MYNEKINSLMNELYTKAEGSNFEGFISKMQQIMSFADENIISIIASRNSNDVGYYRSSTAKITDSFTLDTSVLPEEIKRELNLEEKNDKIIMAMNKFADLTISYKLNNSKEIEQVKITIEADQHNNSLSDVYSINVATGENKRYFEFRHSLKSKTNYKKTDIAHLAGTKYNDNMTINRSLCFTGKNNFSITDEPIAEIVFED